MGRVGSNLTINYIPLQLFFQRPLVFYAGNVSVYFINRVKSVTGELIASIVSWSQVWMKEKCFSRYFLVSCQVKNCEPDLFINNIIGFFLSGQVQILHHEINIRNRRDTIDGFIAAIGDAEALKQ